MSTAIDKAERLRSLINKISIVSQGHGIRANGSSHHIGSMPLWEALSNITLALDYPDYAAFRTSFVSLVQSIRSDVAVIPLQKESVREVWLSCTQNISEVFDAANFGTQTAQVFANHFSQRNMEVLEYVSERFQTAEWFESAPSELEVAVKAVRTAIEALVADKGIDLKIAVILKHYLQQIEEIYHQFEDFGDVMFWKIYKETFGTFVQLHPIIAQLDDAEGVFDKIRAVAASLISKSIVGTTVAANLAGVATFALPYFKK